MSELLSAFPPSYVIVFSSVSATIVLSGVQVIIALMTSPATRWGLLGYILQIVNVSGMLYVVAALLSFLYTAGVVLRGDCSIAYYIWFCATVLILCSAIAFWWFQRALIAETALLRE